MVSNSTNEFTTRRSHGSYGDLAPSLSSSVVNTIIKKGRRKRRGRGRDKKRRAGARKKQLKSERKAKTHLRILFWNCGSLAVGYVRKQLRCWQAVLTSLCARDAKSLYQTRKLSAAHQE